MKLNDVFFLATLFFIYLLNFVTNPIIDRALQLTYRVLPIFLVPLLMYLTNFHLKLDYDKLKKSFVMGIVVSCSMSIIIGLFNFIKLGDVHVLFYYELGDFLHIHPTYYALFILTAIHFLINENTIFNNRIKITLILFFIVFLFLLQVKIAFFGLFFYVLFYLFLYKRKSFLKKGFLISLLLFITLASIGSQFEFNRFNEIFMNRNSIELGNNNEDGVYQRLWLWREANRQIKEKPLLGYGLGAQKSIFKWKAEKYNLETNVSNEYAIAAKQISKLNLHNQYLQVIYELGIVGGLFYFGSIIMLIINGLRHKKIDFIIIYSYFLLFQLTENLFERQMAIYFYAFMITLLYLEKNGLQDSNKCITHI